MLTLVEVERAVASLRKDEQVLSHGADRGRQTKAFACTMRHEHALVLLGRDDDGEGQASLTRLNPSLG